MKRKEELEKQFQDNEAKYKSQQHEHYFNEKPYAGEQELQMDAEKTDQ